MKTPRVCDSVGPLGELCGGHVVVNGRNWHFKNQFREAGRSRDVAGRAMWRVCPAETQPY